MLSRGKYWLGAATAAILLTISTTAQSASVSNFSSVFDGPNARIQFSFDIVPVDANTPNGVDSINFDLDDLGATVLDPFIPGSRLLFSSVSGATGEILDDDEFIVDFPVLTVPTSVLFIIADIRTREFFVDPSYSMDLFLNTAAGATPSTLGLQILSEVANQSDFTPGAVVPLPAAAWLFLGALGSLGALRWLRRSKAASA